MEEKDSLVDPSICHCCCCCLSTNTSTIVGIYDSKLVGYFSCARFLQISELESLGSLIEASKEAKGKSTCSSHF